MHPHYPEYDWATLSVWAWGYSRVVDYLVTLENVDKDKIVVTGHSRGGKTALLAGAMDLRIAITYDLDAATEQIMNLGHCSMARTREGFSKLPT